MSTCTHQSMTNRHVSADLAGSGILGRIGTVLHTWHKRHTRRYELTLWGERDIRDAGLSRGDVLYEAGKPFWRA